MSLICHLITENYAKNWYRPHSLETKMHNYYLSPLSTSHINLFNVIYAVISFFRSLTAVHLTEVVSALIQIYQIHSSIHSTLKDNSGNFISFYGFNRPKRTSKYIKLVLWFWCYGQEWKANRFHILIFRNIISFEYFFNIIDFNFNSNTSYQSLNEWNPSKKFQR